MSNNRTKSNIRESKKGKVQRQMAGKCQLHQQSKSWVILSVGFFITQVGFQLCDSCFLLRGEKIIIIKCEVSFFFFCCQRRFYKNGFWGKYKKINTDTQRKRERVEQGTGRGNLVNTLCLLPELWSVRGSWPLGPVNSSVPDSQWEDSANWAFSTLSVWAFSHLTVWMFSSRLLQNSAPWLWKNSLR